MGGAVRGGSPWARVGMVGVVFDHTANFRVYQYLRGVGLYVRVGEVWCKVRDVACCAGGWIDV